MDGFSKRIRKGVRLIMIKVRIEGISEDKLKEILSVIGSKATIQVTHRRQYKRIQEKRGDLVLSVLNSEFVSMGSLYKKVRIRGYRMRMKTLTRDVERLALNNKVLVKKKTGYGGNTTLIKKFLEEK